MTRIKMYIVMGLLTGILSLLMGANGCLFSGTTTGTVTPTSNTTVTGTGGLY